nr:MAG: hypothetical protein J07AB56_01090 [Candidatus Nanosalinarum sp. J07AB56]
MRCRFCGDEFDSERGLHVHQSQAHNQVEKSVRDLLDQDVADVKEEDQGLRHRR